MNPPNRWSFEESERAVCLTFDLRIFCRLQRPTGAWGLQPFWTTTLVYRGVRAPAIALDQALLLHHHLCGTPSQLLLRLPTSHGEDDLSQLAVALSLAGSWRDRYSRHPLLVEPRERKHRIAKYDDIRATLW